MSPFFQNGRNGHFLFFCHENTVHFPWFLFPAGGWGIGIIFYFLAAYGSLGGTMSVEKEYQKLKNNMRTLIIGTGVIGTIYGWALSESGVDITHLVKKAESRNI